MTQVGRHLAALCIKVVCWSFCQQASYSHLYLSGACLSVSLPCPALPCPALLCLGLCCTVLPCAYPENCSAEACSNAAESTSLALIRCTCMHGNMTLTWYLISTCFDLHTKQSISGCRHHIRGCCSCGGSLECTQWHLGDHKFLQSSYPWGPHSGAKL